MSNNVYDRLKDVALIYLPALATLWLTVSQIWSLPYGESIAATITAIAVFLGACLKISSYFYNKEKIDEDGLQEALDNLGKALDKKREDGPC